MQLCHCQQLLPFSCSVATLMLQSVLSHSRTALPLSCYFATVVLLCHFYIGLLVVLYVITVCILRIDDCLAQMASQRKNWLVISKFAWTSTFTENWCKPLWHCAWSIILCTNSNQCTCWKRLYIVRVHYNDSQYECQSDSMSIQVSEFSSILSDSKGQLSCDETCYVEFLSYSLFPISR